MDKAEVVRFLMEQYFLSENQILESRLTTCQDHIREYKKLIKVLNIQITHYANIVSNRNQHIDRLQRHINWLYRQQRRRLNRVLIQDGDRIQLFRRNQDGVYVPGDDEDTESEEVEESEPESEPPADIARRLGFESESEEEPDLLDRLLYDTP